MTDRESEESEERRERRERREGGLIRRGHNAGPA